MRIFLEPHESLLFRTGRPFDAGETDYAETLFPPTPETIQGAVRSLLATAYNPGATLPELFHPGSELVKLIGDRESYGRFRITTTALGRRKQGSKDIELLYPVPAHLVKDIQGFFRLKPDEGKEISSNMPVGMRYLFPERELKPDEKPQSVEGWLSEADLRSVLSADTDLTGIRVVEKEEIFIYEPRIGIGMDNATKSTREGLFYSVQMLRMQPGYGFVVDVRLADETSPEGLLPDEQTRKALNLQARDQGWAVLGGEQRAASYKIIGESAPPPHQATHLGHSTLLYLATPAALKKGWQPEAWPADLAPIAAAIPRYQSIGGWKLHPGHSGGDNKSMRRCVPAGSVYFFDREVPANRPLTDIGWQIGYGIAYTGEY